MRTDALALLATLAACGHGTEEVVISTPSARAPERVAAGIPHGGFIQTIATTEQGDAALTLDNLGALRLWPSLDGKRPPVPVAATGISELALGHAGDDLLVALLDQAGAVQLLRLGRDGRVHAKAQLPGDVRIEQVVAFDGGVLVERGDQSIERYDADGKPRGRLLAGPGETLGAMSVRHGSAAVLVQAAEIPVESEAGAPPLPEGKLARQPIAGAAPPPIAATLRWIVVGDELRWGTAIKLPASIDARALALAPNHRRIAVIDAHASVLQVFDLDPLPTRIPGSTPGITPTGTIGFTDDDHVAVATGSVAWWIAPQAKSQQDPWATTPANDLFGSVGEGGAVGDGLVITGFGSGLALANERASHYLGWNVLGNGATSAAGSGFLLVTSVTHAAWLDSALVLQAESDLDKLSGGAPQYVAWVDRTHAIIERARDGKYEVELVDTAHPEAKPVRIGTYQTVERLEYDADLKLLSIGSSGQNARFAIDPVHGTVTSLPAMKTSLQAISVRLLDPARAGGAIAIVTSYEDDGQRLAIFHEPDPSTKQVRAQRTVPLHGSVLGIAPTGLVYLKSESPPYEISALRDGKPVAKLPAELAAETITAITPSHDATRLAVQRGTEIAIVDAAGVAQWHAALWSVLAVTFSTDDRTLLVRTSGGLVALDAATGERRASACAFGFGLADKAPAQMQGTLGVAPVCEDPTR